ncbi:MAG: hypothetical protein EON52_06195 [Actinomycetales bacterium]|nr:MAG: hypothetical protein EON52_06195 [Actinomycetales bacterium]
MSRLSAILARLGSTGGLPALLSCVGALFLAGVLAVSGLAWPAVVLLLLSVPGELVLERRARALGELLDQAALGLPMRFVLRVVVALLAAEHVDSTAALRVFVVVAVLESAVLSLRALHTEYRRVGPLRPMNTRNIPGSPTMHVSPPQRGIAIVGSQLLTLAPALLGLAWGLVLLLGLAGVAYLAALTVPDALASWRMRQAKRATGFTPPLRQVQDFIDEYRPEVVLHLSGPLGAAYQINTWLESLEHLDRRVLVVLRDHALFTTMRRTSLPVLELSAPGELLMLDFASVRVALYPTNTGNNIHLLRLPHVMSAFIGHGDSDKSASANPFSRVYDELWVAGEAGADRYRVSGLGIHESQFRFVGRPQVHAIRPEPRLGDEPVPTVLYAPTWEGVNTLQEYSSVSSVGERVVKALLASPTPVRVVYKPHPFTGQRDAKYRNASARIAALVTEAAASTGLDHRVVRGGAIEDWMNTSTALVTDISSVVSDYLAGEKPLAVFNHTGLTDEALDEATFRTEYPSTGAATIIGRDGTGIDELVGVVTGDVPDERAADRAALATYLLGPPVKRTLDAFAAAIEAFISRAETERAQYVGLETVHEADDAALGSDEMLDR